MTRCALRYVPGLILSRSVWRRVIMPEEKRGKGDLAALLHSGETWVAS